MEKTLEFLVKWKYAFVVAGLIVLTVIVLGAINNYLGNKEDELRGYYEGKLAEATAEKAILTEEIAHKTAYIAQIDAENEILLETRVHDERRLLVLLAQVEELQAEEPIQPELEIEPLVVNLRLQIERMTLVIERQEKIIIGNDEMIFNLTQKYSAQLIISEDYKKLYENESELHSLAVKRLTVSENRIKGLRFGSKIKTGIMVAVIGAGAYLLIAK